MSQLVHFIERRPAGQDTEFVVIDTQNLLKGELEEEFEAEVHSVVFIDGDVAAFPTDRALTED